MLEAQPQRQTLATGQDAREDPEVGSVLSLGGARLVHGDVIPERRARLVLEALGGIEGEPERLA